MRALLGAALTVLSLAGTARAQDGYDWYLQGGDAGQSGAQAIGCLPGEVDQIFTSLCLYVGCEEGQAAQLGLGLQHWALPPETSVSIAVDGQGVAELILPVASGSPGGAVPLDGLEGLLAALRAGEVAQVSLATAEGPRSYDLPLRGSRAVIDAALAACAVPAADAAAPARTSEDPAGEAIAQNEAFCAGGATAVEPGFLTQADMDGDGVNDVLVDFAGLTCDGSRAFCGSGGCTQQVWLGAADAPYRLLLDDFVERIERPAPGRIRVVKDGADCGRSGAEVCIHDYRVEGDALRPLEEAP